MLLGGSMVLGGSTLSVSQPRWRWDLRETDRASVQGVSRIWMHKMNSCDLGIESWPSAKHKWFPRLLNSISTGRSIHRQIILIVLNSILGEKQVARLHKSCANTCKYGYAWNASDDLHALPAPQREAVKSGVLIQDERLETWSVVHLPIYVTKANYSSLILGMRSRAVGIIHRFEMLFPLYSSKIMIYHWQHQQFFYGVLNTFNPFVLWLILGW